MMEMGLSDLTKGDPLKNDHQLETGAAAPAIAGGCCFFSPRSYVLFKGKMMKTPWFWGLWGNLMNKPDSTQAL